MEDKILFVGTNDCIVEREILPPIGKTSALSFMPLIEEAKVRDVKIFLVGKNEKDDLTPQQQRMMLGLIHHRIHYIRAARMVTGQRI